VSQGRLPSLFLLSTQPVGGIWFPPRAKDQANKARKWHWDGKKICWQPSTPDGADKKQEFIDRLLNKVAASRMAGPSAFLKLSGTSKTGISWSLPAVGACPQVDETCGTCYALDGFYRTNTAAQVGRVMRLEYLRALIASGNLTLWIEWAVEKISRLRPVEPVPSTIALDKPLACSLDAHGQAVAYFRWHDSGDLFHAEYAKAVIEVCRRTPNVLHWLPTRMGGLLAKLVGSGERLPPNLAVQVSCHRGGMLEQAQHLAISAIHARQPDARIGVTYAHTGTKSRMATPSDVHTAFGSQASLCPATVAVSSDDRVCTGCRRCWAQAKNTSPIVYAVHLGN